MPLARTPLHPQWLVLRGRTRTLHWIRQHTSGTVLDIGCGDARIRDAISDDTDYIGLDYPPTMALGYQGRPDSGRRRQAALFPHEHGHGPFA